MSDRDDSFEAIDLRAILYLEGKGKLPLRPSNAGRAAKDRQLLIDILTTVEARLARAASVLDLVIEPRSGLVPEATRVQLIAVRDILRATRRLT